MEKHIEHQDRIKQSEEMRAEHQKNHLANLRIFHGWLGKRFFHKGVAGVPKEMRLLQIRNMRITKP